MSEPAVIKNEGGHTRRIGKKGLQMIEEMAAGGMSMTSIAKTLRIGSRTFYDIRRRQPEVVEALERGYSAMEDQLVSALKERALDPDRKDSTVAAIFLLKSRRGYEIGDQKIPSHLTIVNNDNRQQVIQLPSPADRQAYLKRIAEVEDGAT
ncbi:hypothetical protein ATO10_09748 [Actibacterium atlanticum]|uniref:Uncharacterized protein n=1 Tax=Actibacterium atlanticum TaxID=1461693 RepID=A0A058ZKG9_9RHOB|nr:hypothetical protein [Actibacterium atlanticum]KCV82119.1 hypothetical protein ATO10_09748 [Actibacterium atlanticum]